MSAFLKIVTFVLLILAGPYANAAEMDMGSLSKGNPFSPEYEKNRLKGVHILPIDDPAFPARLKSEIRRELTEKKENGYVKTKESAHQQTKDSIKAIKSESASEDLHRIVVNEKERQVKSKVVGVVANVTSTPLSTATLIDIQTQGALTASGWTGVSRLFEDEYFGSVILSEDNFDLSNGTVVWAAEAVNARINGNAGILILQKGPDGEPYTKLWWATSNKFYELSVSIDASKGMPLERLMKLAESL